MKVNINVLGGRIVLRWTYQGRRRSLPIGQESPVLRRVAEKIAAQIEGDLATGNFDQSLRKYQLQDKRAAETVSALFDRYCKFKYKEKKLPDKYRAISNHLKRWPRSARAIQLRDCQAFINGLSDGAKRAYLPILKACWDWAGIDNPWESVTLPRNQRHTADPFSHAEVEKILAAFEQSYYLPYVKGLLSLGCRPGELAALTWEDLDFEQRLVTIDKSWSDRENRVKSTKTGKTRILPMSCGFMSVLDLVRTDQRTGLIFPSPRNGHISPRLFLRRHWAPALERAGVRYRPQYNSRHTVWSHAIAEGMSVSEAAEYAGNRSETMLRHYVGRVTRSEMPNLF